MSTPQFGRLVRMLAGVADTCCQGRLVAVTEGGYDLQAFGECLRTTIEALSGSSAQVDAAPGGAAPRGEAALAAIRPHLSGTWTL